MDEQKIQVEPQGTDEQEPKQEKKKLSKKKRIVIGVIMIAIAVGALILGIMIQAKGFDLFIGENTTSVTHVAEASSNSAKTASTDIPQGKNLFNVLSSYTFNNCIVTSDYSSLTQIPTFDSLSYSCFTFNLKSGFYTFSFILETTAKNDPCVRIVYKDTSISFSSLYKCFELKSDCVVSFYFYNAISYNAFVGVPYIFKNLQLEEGSTATAYEPNYDALIAYGTKDSTNRYNYFVKNDLYRCNYRSNGIDGEIYESKYYFNGLAEHVLFDFRPNYYSSSDLIGYNQDDGNYHIKDNAVELHFKTYSDVVLWHTNNPNKYLFTFYYSGDGSEIEVVEGFTYKYDEFILIGNEFEEFYKNGFNDGYQNGHIDGVEDGYNGGYKQAENDYQKLDNLFFSIFDAPFSVFRDAFNFEIFGINVSALILFFITILCVGFVIKKLI